jgi:hypothetical protein
VASFHRLTAAQPNLSHDPHRHHAHAFEAIAATLPLASMGYEPQLNAKGEARLKRVKTFCFNREHINLPPAEFVELFRAESVYPELQKKLGIASTNEQPSNAQSTIDVVERSEAEQGDEQPDPASRTAQPSRRRRHVRWRCYLSCLACHEPRQRRHDCARAKCLAFWRPDLRAGGIIIGIATMLPVEWARLGGICFCLLRILSGVLWFVSDEPTDRLPLAWNLTTAPLTVAGALYSCFGGPVSGLRAKGWPLFFFARGIVTEWRRPCGALAKQGLRERSE